jgi:ribosomal protein S18 acetylase RimI-like enzyme
VSSNQYRITLKRPSVQEFLTLRKKIGWGELDLILAEKSLENSLFHVTIYDNSALIGMGRVVGDGAMYFYIQDVIVDPRYQKSGVGTSLMKQIEKYLAENTTKGSTIGLLAAKGKEAFYSRYGYVERPTSSLGNGMCKFV